MFSFEGCRIQPLLASLLVFVLFYSFPTTSKAQISGCTDPLATNYNEQAVVNDGSCVYPGTIISFQSRVQLPSIMDETSGLIYWNNKFWTHNDDTDLNLYGFTFENPSEFETIEMSGLTNIDWEELTQDDNYLYIGEFGNNSGNRTDLKIYRVSKSSALSGNPVAEVIAFSYEDQTNFNPPGANQTDFDAEAFIVKGDKIFIFTKEWVSRGTTVYEIPNQPGEHVAINRGRLQIDAMVTGSVYLEQENLIAFIGYNFPEIGPTFIYLLYDFQGDDFFGGNKRMLVLRLTDFLAHQVEAITTKDGLTFYATNEFASGSGLTIPQRMHSFDLSPYLETYLSSLPEPSRYYYRGYGDITNPDSWASNPNGSGRTPSDFSADNTAYFITTSDSIVISNAWEITGTNASVHIGHAELPVSVTLNTPIQATFNVLENASLYVDGIAPPPFGELADNSVVVLMQIPNLVIPEASFFDLRILDSEFNEPDNAVSLAFRGDVLMDGNQNSLSGNYSFTFNGSDYQVLSSNTSLEIQELIINKPTGMIDLTVDAFLRVNHAFFLESGELNVNTELFLTSGGFFWNDTDSEPEITFERLISAPSLAQGSSYWTLFTAPVPGNIAGEQGFLSSIWTQGFPGSDNPDATPASVFRFNSEDLWLAPEQNLWISGAGYAVQINDRRFPDVPGNPVDFTSPLQIKGAQTSFPDVGFTFPGLSYFVGSPSGNLHLLGNPFAVPLDWSINTTEAWQRSGIADFIYIWNPTSQSFLLAGLHPLPESLLGLITTEPIIGPFQSFWVQSTTDAPLLRVGKQARTTEQPNSGLFNGNAQQAVIALGFNDQLYSGFLIHEHDGSEQILFSATYINPPGDSFTFFYSCYDEQPSLLSNLILPDDTPLQIPLFIGTVAPFVVPAAEGTFTWPVIENFPDAWLISLTDLETGTITDLKTSTSYTFEYSPESIDEGFEFNRPDCSLEGSNPRFVLTIENDATHLQPGGTELPTVTELHQNYPNPFNPTTGISFHLAESGSVFLGVYDILGRLISVVTQEHLPAGSHFFTFDASHLSSGTYLYKLRTEHGQFTKKMTLLK